MGSPTPPEQLVISFVPLQTHHFPLLLKWLQSPPVKAWWDSEVAWTPELIAAKYGPYVRGVKEVQEGGRKIEKPLSAFVVRLNGEDAGYIQYYNAYDFPPEEAYTLEGFPSNLGSFDLFIGEENWRGRGCAPRILKTFLKEHVFEKFSSCLALVDTANIKAVNTYKKAGFSLVRTALEGKLTLLIAERQKGPLKEA